MNEFLFLDHKNPFENFDKIQFVSPNEVDKLLKWRDKNKDLVRNFNFVLEQGYIDLTFNGVKLIFEKQSDKVYLDMVMKRNGKFSHFLTFFWNYKEGTVSYIHPEKRLIEKDFDFFDENTQSMITIFASLMAFMEHYKEEKQVIQKRSVVSNKVKNRKKKGKKKTVRKIGNTHYMINVEKAYQEPKRVYNLDKDKAWTVRGHWRTYSNGKKVWIKPYKKGNLDDDSEPATYNF